MTQRTPTQYWNDSCAVAELQQAVVRGATGATSNPSIVHEVLGKESAHWLPRIRELATDHPDWGEVGLTWAVAEEMAVRGAAVLEPVFTTSGGRTGRMSMQVNPANHRSAALMLQQAQRFATLAPNMQVKFPNIAPGLVAIEEATALGININATVSFSVPQAIAAAEAVERGLSRFAADGGGDAESMTPVITLMIGRMDDWVKLIADRDGISLSPDAAEWAGIAVFKRAYALFGERGYRARLLAAAYRNTLHWTELVGGDVTLTMPFAWQLKFDALGIDPESRIDVPVDADLIADLLTNIPDFRRAYEPDGMSAAEFESFGPSARTLRAFIKSYHDLQGAIRDVYLPDPDIKAT
ncbi:MAG: transaldolase [Chloroflexota bacterium]|jgi:transaldolase|nr:transaldolase [Chloroflexota bacterium]